jgi:cellulose synthase/poly-beta-1,6-N-acetylglucosamine synthase-like glycosyltransferase
VTVVVPVHDDAAGAARCLEALRGQDYPPDRFEVLICDNASAQPLGDIGSGSGHPRVRVLDEPVAGSYRARNRCLAEGYGDVVAFTDADCTPDRRWLAEGVAALAAGNDLAAGRVSVYPSRARLTPLEAHEMVAAFPQQKYVETMGFGVTANLFVARAVLDQLGPFDEHLTSGGDREFCTRATTAGRRIVYAPGAVVAHPARATVAEVWEKVRRVRRGAYEERRLVLPLTTWARRLLPPVGAVKRSRDARLPRGARWKYVVGETTAHYLAVAAETPYVLRSRRGRTDGAVRGAA